VVASFFDLIWRTATVKNGEVRASLIQSATIAWSPVKLLLSHCMTSIPNIMLRNTQNTIHMDVEKRNSEKKEEKKG
jgi:hypothetical protein